MRTLTKELRDTITPAQAIDILRKGNERFQNNLKANRNLLQQANDLRDGQFPFAAILSCIDSRTSAELIFAQGLGDVFSIRIAGNFVNDDILGSLEFACKVAGSKLIVVLGHSSCGAIKGACDHVELGHLTGMLAKLQPAVESVTEPRDPALRTSQNAEFVQAVANANIDFGVAQVHERSPLLREMHEKGEIAIVGGMYDISSGAVEFHTTPEQLERDA